MLIRRRTPLGLTRLHSAPLGWRASLTTRTSPSRVMSVFRSTTEKLQLFLFFDASHITCLEEETFLEVFWFIWWNLPKLFSWFHRTSYLMSSIRTPMLVQGRLERTETNLIHLKWEVTWTHGSQSNAFEMRQRVYSHSRYWIHILLNARLLDGSYYKIKRVCNLSYSDLSTCHVTWVLITTVHAYQSIVTLSPKIW